MKKKVFVILVAYNPSNNELFESVSALSLQSDFIVICNNSTEDLFKAGRNVHVINFRENFGIAKAQSIGMKWAFQNGADFVLQMDQDSRPDKGMVEKLLDSYSYLSSRDYNVGLIGPQDYDKYSGEVNKARVKQGVEVESSNIFIVSSTLSSGSLIPLKAYKVIGGMYDDLFIDAVDHEYCWRLRKCGFVVARNNNAKLGHRLGEGKKKIFGFLQVGNPAPIRHYYAFRNSIFLMNKSYVPMYWKLSSFVKLIFKFIVYPIVFDDGKARSMYMKMGIKDALKKRLGRIGK